MNWILSRPKLLVGISVVLLLIALGSALAMWRYRRMAVQSRETISSEVRRQADEWVRVQKDMAEDYKAKWQSSERKLSAAERDRESLLRRVAELEKRLESPAEPPKTLEDANNRLIRQGF